jgi:hypothetical protein
VTVPRRKVILGEHGADRQCDVTRYRLSVTEQPAPRRKRKAPKRVALAFIVVSSSGVWWLHNHPAVRVRNL